VSSVSPVLGIFTCWRIELVDEVACPESEVNCTVFTAFEIALGDEDRGWRRRRRWRRRR
jgi:hypothetical protein